MSINSSRNTTGEMTARSMTNQPKNRLKTNKNSVSENRPNVKREQTSSQDRVKERRKTLTISTQQDKKNPPLNSNHKRFSRVSKEKKRNA